VFWVDVDSPSTAKNGFLTIAKTLESPAQDIKDVLILLANEKRPWLLVLDNADDPVFNYATYFPSGDRGAVLMTSRVHDCKSFSTIKAEDLEGLDLEHSVELLLKATRIEETLWPSQRADAEAIVGLLGSHTLALIQAGSYIAKGFSSLDQYPKKFADHRKRLLRHFPRQEHSRYKGCIRHF